MSGGYRSTLRPSSTEPTTNTSRSSNERSAPNHRCRTGGNVPQRRDRDEPEGLAAAGPAHGYGCPAPVPEAGRTAWAWIAVMATVLTMSRIDAPRDRSLTGLLSPCRTGPIATVPADRWTAL